MNVHYALVIVFLLLEECFGLSWLAVGLAGSRFDRSKLHASCKNMKGLNKRQINKVDLHSSGFSQAAVVQPSPIISTGRDDGFCKQYPLLMDSIRLGAASAYSECQFQFTRRRWNCSLIDPISREVVGGVLLAEGTRESAFVHAVSAAGVAYRVTRDCAKGLNGDHCGCDHSKRQGQDMQGCSEHVQYGMGISREFVDAAERMKNGTGNAVVNLHNNRAGRQVLEKSLRRECKCHGMSGSCEVKTCWDSMPTFREIGALIKDKFDGASEVSVEEEEDQPRIVMKNTQFKRHTNADLVYMTPSPDFCEADSERGILGTRGRECNASSNGVDGCQLLCCNRGYEKRISYVKEMCNCKFHYCCRVECDPCEKKIERFFCL